MRLPYLPLLVLVGSIALQPCHADAGTIDFSEPEVTALMTNVGIGLHTTYYSNPLSTFALEGVSLTASGQPYPNNSPFFAFRTTFDDRSPDPYSYDFIDENVLQAYSTGLDISFGTPVSTFGFGAAIDATASPSLMQVELFGPGNLSLGTFNFTLDRTTLSLKGGTNSNSEGLFVAPAVGLISGARLTNFGDGTDNGSELGWVIDNITYNSEAPGNQSSVPTPEPTSAVLLVTGLIGAAKLRARRRTRGV